MPTFPQLQSLQETFYPFYVITAVRKFFFFLDPKRTGKIQIKDMLTSPILAELYELRQEQLNMDDALQNWFSVQSSLRVYDQYLKLDQDKNGMLKKHELSNFSKGLQRSLSTVSSKSIRPSKEKWITRRSWTSSWQWKTKSHPKLCNTSGASSTYTTREPSIHSSSICSSEVSLQSWRQGCRLTIKSTI